jgi:hypothetical protein
VNILVISFAQSRLDTPDILNWLTAPENKSGVNREAFWLINTDVRLVNVHADKRVENLMALLHMSEVHDYQAIMINKDV